MSIINLGVRALSAALALIPFTCLASGGDDHTHGDEPKLAMQEAAPRVVAATESFEIVGVLDASGVTLYLDRSDTTAPVTDATISADVGGSTLTAKADGQGTYRLEGSWAEQSGRHDFVFTVASGDEVDLIAGSLVVPEGVSQQRVQFGQLAWGGSTALLVAGLAGFWLLRRRRVSATPASLGAAVLIGAIALASSAARASGGDDHTHGDEAVTAPTGFVLGVPDAPRRLPNGSLFIPKPTQRLLALRTTVASSAPAARTVRLVGLLVPDPTRAGLVQSASGGRVVPPAGGLPRLGAMVRQGDVLLRIEPPVSGGDLATISQERTRLLADLETAERRLARLEGLSGTVAGREIDDTRAQVEMLRLRRAELDSSAARREVLRAPVSGRVARMDVAAGQVVGPDKVLVEVVADDALVVDASSYGATQFGEHASAMLPDGRVLALRRTEQGTALANQAVTVRFRVDASAPAPLQVYSPVTVLAQTVEQQEGIKIPRDSVVQSTAGTPMVWVKVAPETFAPRDIRYEELDGEHVLVVAGLKSPARVVVAASTLINQVR